MPYVGRHGELGVERQETKFTRQTAMFAPLYRVAIGKGGQKDVCAMANCMMTTIKALGASCNYICGRWETQEFKYADFFCNVIVRGAGPTSFDNASDWLGQQLG